MKKRYKTMVVPALVLASFFSTCLKDVNADGTNITDNLSVSTCGIERVYKYRDYLNNVAFYSERDFKYLEDSWAYTGVNWYENVLNMFTNSEIKQYIKNKSYNRALRDITEEVSCENENNYDLDYAHENKYLTRKPNLKDKHKDQNFDDIVIVY